MGLAGEVCRWGCEGAAAGLRGGPPVSDFFVEMVSKPAYRPCVSVFRAAVWLRQAYVRFWVAYEGLTTCGALLESVRNAFRIGCGPERLPENEYSHQFHGRIAGLPIHHIYNNHIE